MGQGSARPVILPQPLSMGYFQAIMKDERLKLCPRVQTPAPVLGRLHATVPGILAVLVVRRTGREIALQPPASDQPSQYGSQRTLPDLVVGVSPLHNPAARSVLETAPGGTTHCFAATSQRRA